MHPLTVLLAPLIALATTGTLAQPSTPRIEIGVLTCSVAGGVGMILGSQKDVSCVLKRANGSEELYSGRITRIGVDIGITTTTIISWGVLARPTCRQVRSLAPTAGRRPRRRSALASAPMRSLAARPGRSASSR